MCLHVLTPVKARANRMLRNPWRGTWVRPYTIV